MAARRHRSTAWISHYRSPPLPLGLPLLWIQSTKSPASPSSPLPAISSAPFCPSPPAPTSASTYAADAARPLTRPPLVPQHNRPASPPRRPLLRHPLHPSPISCSSNARKCAATVVRALTPLLLPPFLVAVAPPRTGTTSSSSSPSLPLSPHILRRRPPGVRHRLRRHLLLPAGGYRLVANYSFPAVPVPTTASHCVCSQIPTTFIPP